MSSGWEGRWYHESFCKRGSREVCETWTILWVVFRQHCGQVNWFRKSQKKPACHTHSHHTTTPSVVTAPSPSASSSSSSSSSSSLSSSPSPSPSLSSSSSSSSSSSPSSSLWSHHHLRRIRHTLDAQPRQRPKEDDAQTVTLASTDVCVFQ